MKTIKSLILGSAAGLLAVGGAQAADLPLKAKAVEYVKVCSLYGAGFYYIPGTDTCVKIGGYLRVDVLGNTNADATGNTAGAGGANNRFTNGYTWRSRSDLSVDTRTATDYGVVRTYGEVVFSWTDDTFAGTGTGASVYSSIGGVQAPNNANAGAVAYGGLGVYYAYIQFAGFTFGKAISQFSAPWTNYPGNNFDGLVGGGGAVTGVNQFTYTSQFGNGVSGTISLQDQTAYYQAGVNNLNAAALYGASDYAGSTIPDIVGSIAVDQAWGYLQFSAAAHDNHAAYYGGTELSGHPEDKWGWAVQAALQIKNIPTGAGDDIKIQGVYTSAATRYNIQDLSQSGAMTIYGGTSLAGAYQSVGIGVAPDTVFAAGTSQQAINTWGVRGAFNHNWDAYWSSALYGAYAGIMYSGGAKTLVCNTPGVGFAAAVTAGAAVLSSCNPNYNVGQLGFITRWTPVKNLTFSGDVTWTHLDQKYAGTLVDGSASIGKPGTPVTYQLKDQDTVTFLLRAQRNF
jgi:hypothetical protein